MSLALGYGPVITGFVLGSVWFDVPFWLAVLGIVFGGAILTIAIATLRSASELSARSRWKRSGEQDGHRLGRPAENGTSPR